MLSRLTLSSRALAEQVYAFKSLCSFEGVLLKVHTTIEMDLP